jgi:hypothetical protein
MDANAVAQVYLYARGHSSVGPQKNLASDQRMPNLGRAFGSGIVKQISAIDVFIVNDGCDVALALPRYRVCATPCRGYIRTAYSWHDEEISLADRKIQVIPELDDCDIITLHQGQAFFLCTVYRWWENSPVIGQETEIVFSTDKCLADYYNIWTGSISVIWRVGSSENEESR